MEMVLYADLADVVYTVHSSRTNLPSYNVRRVGGEIGAEDIALYEDVEYLADDGSWYTGYVTARLENHFTTADVVSKIVIPETAREGCCYAETFPGGTKQPETLMSHWWGNKFLDLVKVMMILFYINN